MFDEYDLHQHQMKMIMGKQEKYFSSGFEHRSRVVRQGPCILCSRTGMLVWPQGPDRQDQKDKSEE